MPESGLSLDVGETPVLIGIGGRLSTEPEGAEGFSTGAVPVGAAVVTGTGDTMTVEVEAVPFLYPY